MSVAVKMLKTGGTDQKMTKEEFIEEANVSAIIVKPFYLVSHLIYYSISQRDGV